MQFSIQNIVKYIVLALLLKIIYDFIFGGMSEGFYNIRPTTLIDPEYYNINQDPFDYRFKGNGYLRVGDTYGVDLKCGNVTIEDLLAWIERNHPHILHQYVYLYDPSVNIYNPRFTPRVFKELLKNLPEKHPILRILRKCLPKPTRVS